jgi:hypothetical protein
MKVFGSFVVVSKLRKFDLTTKDPVRQSRNQIPEYLPQRRKGRKGRKKPD